MIWDDVIGLDSFMIWNDVKSENMLLRSDDVIGSGQLDDRIETA